VILISFFYIFWFCVFVFVYLQPWLWQFFRSERVWLVGDRTISPRFSVAWRHGAFPAGSIVGWSVVPSAQCLGAGCGVWHQLVAVCQAAYPCFRLSRLVRRQRNRSYIACLCWRCSSSNASFPRRNPGILVVVGDTLSA
jgi:hypothetical protein